MLNTSVTSDTSMLSLNSSVAGHHERPVNVRSKSSGILQLLLETERRGRERVARARDHELQRLRDAKVEAAAQIAVFKEVHQRQLERKITEVESEMRGFIKAVYRDFDEIEEKDIQNVAARRKDVVQRILQLVTDVQPRLPTNFVLRREVEVFGTYTRISPEINKF